MRPLKVIAFTGLGLAIGIMGLYVAEADDAPGAAAIGLVLTVAGVWLGVRAAQNRLPTWVARTALAVGVVVAAFAAFVAQQVAATALNFPGEQVPSGAGAAPPPQHAAAVERAREFVRAAALQQNLPGMSVAVGADDTIVWAEGFGWRDVVTRSPVTPDTRFNIGTAASAIAAAAATLGLANTGTDQAAEWSPEHIGEPEEDFPPLTLLRRHVWQPLGLMANEYPLPGDRATFYVPRAGDDPRQGRRLMYMRDLACCANGMAFYSTPSDLVRVGLATNIDTVDGDLAGGMVMSLVTARDRGLVVAVTSNIAHANTSPLALRIREAFAAGTQ